MASDLTAKQKAFIREYLLCRNASEAARKAGYGDKNADKIGHQLLGNTRVSFEIAKQEKKDQKKYEATKDNLVDLLAGIAFLDPLDILEETKEGEFRFKKLKDMPKQARVSLEIYGTLKKKNPFISLKSFSKDKAIELLSKHVGLDNAKSGSSEEARKSAIERLSQYVTKRLEGDGDK